MAAYGPGLPPWLKETATEDDQPSAPSNPSSSDTSTLHRPEPEQVLAFQRAISASLQTATTRLLKTSDLGTRAKQIISSHVPLLNIIQYKLPSDLTVNNGRVEGSLIMRVSCGNNESLKDLTSVCQSSEATEEIKRWLEGQKSVKSADYWDQGITSHGKALAGLVALSRNIGGGEPGSDLQDSLQAMMPIYPGDPDADLQISTAGEEGKKRLLALACHGGFDNVPVTLSWRSSR